MNEQELSEQCKQGDNRARRLLYECYAGRMLGVCLRYAGDSDTAQDWVHDGFIQVFRQIDKFVWRGHGSLQAWIQRLMITTALQHLRKPDVMRLTLDIEAAADEDYEEPQENAIDEIPTQVLMTFVAELPEGYRTVFNLFVMDGKTHKEIAALLGIAERSSASQLVRAKGTLAKRIREYVEQSEPT
jgi:RNA polymerase sigma-70 factor (ECF subfamily)